ncbi:MAG: LPXTG cell wall anchor domain-containing protein [Aureispira sp.]|nr:LPXTG cell wall anchor domain-containing protein [Aureispira sp.]
MGNTNPISIATKGRNWLWWLVGGGIGLVLLIGGVIFGRKKEIT